MGFFHLNSLPKSKRIQMIGEFYDTIDSLKDRQEVRLFFKALLTGDEIANLMRRIEIAVLLSGKFNYDQIITMIGVGRDKISAVNKSLLQDDSGYRIIIKRLIKDRKKRLKKMKKEERRTAAPLAGLKTHSRFLILNTIIDAAIENSINDKELEKEALLFTPSSNMFKGRKSE
jgi:TrpR-related protein YerC/YecD